jgi:D-alanine-D-alanine ligase
MRVAVLHNEVSAQADPAERDVLVQAQAVQKALDRLGHEWFALGATLDLETLRRRLQERRPDVVFNLAESLGGSDRLALLVAAVLEAEDIPYTGSSTEGLFLTNHKLLAKERLARAGLPTPAWAVPARKSFGRPFENPDQHPFLPGTKFILKPVSEHASLGMDETAIVVYSGEEDLQRKLSAHSSRLATTCFAERYIDGREFNLSVLAGPSGPEVLPPAEIDFSAFPPGKARIVDYRAKWDEASFEFHHMFRRFDFPDSERRLLEELCRLARACWNLFGLRGYVRVDFRVDAQNRPWILEVNTNPCLSPDAGFAAALAQASIPFEEAVRRILADARP